MSDIDNANPSARWSEVDVNNTAPAPDGFPQASGQDLWVDVPANGRAIMGAIKRFWDRINGTITTTGTAPQYVYTPSNTAFPLAYVQGETYTFKANFTSAGADELNVNALGALPLYKPSPSGPVPVAAGDIQTGQIVQAIYDSALNSGGGGFQVLSGTGASTRQILLFSSTNAVGGTSGTNYFGTSTVGINELLVQMPVPIAGTLRNAYFNVSQAPGTGQSLTFTVRKNGANTAITATISNTATTASDTTHSVTVAAGDLFDFQCAPTSGVPSGTFMNAGIEFDNP